MQISMMEAIKAMEDNNYPQANVNQRFVMTATNNIALFLSDILKQMEEMPENGGEGDENCENGGGSKMGGLKKSAESLKQQLEQLIDQMKNGDGKKMGKELSESLMQHEMMQKMLRDR